MNEVMNKLHFFAQELFIQIIAINKYAFYNIYVYYFYNIYSTLPKNTAYLWFCQKHFCQR